GRAGRDEPHVGHRPRHPGVALINDVAVLVELEASVEMRGGIDGTAARRQGAAVKERLTFVVDRLELHPDVERIDGAAREEMSDLARADDDVETQRFAAAHGCRDAI